jgi:hypothetical protein
MLALQLGLITSGVLILASVPIPSDANRPASLTTATGGAA